MQLDKLSVINDCLLATGNSPVTGDDGSASWIAASNAYDRMLPIVLYKHNWIFQTATANLARIGTSTYPGYSDIYQKPFDCLHVENVWRTDLAIMIPQVSQFGIGGMGAMPPQLDYKIIGDQVHCVAPNGASMLYVIDPTEHADVILDVSAGILETLRREIESLLYQGLNEDQSAAVTTKKLAEAELAEARAKSDTESPRRVAFRAAFTEKRRRPRVGSYYG
jgi:hypothetical protein